MKLQMQTLGILLVVLIATAAPIRASASSDPGTQGTAVSDSLDQSHRRQDQKAHEEGSSHSSGHRDLGPLLPLWSCIPFACMLLSIALLPLAAERFWHHNFGKVSAFWALTLALPFVYAYRGTAMYEILHIILVDYIPFIILLWSLFTVSGGILLKGSLRGTPLVNTVMILIGTILASWMGTTGAAMLMIRPFLRANDYRKSRTFMVVFFIFLVANIGGSLTPLGDPPLFLGFLHGVSFFWTFNILPHMLVTAGILLGVYFLLDLYLYKKEGRTPPEDEAKHPLKLEGTYNFLFLGGVVLAVLFSGIAELGQINTLGVHRTIQGWARDGLLILMGLLSLWATPRKLREENEFTWFPIIEVAYLFIGIFITMTPCLLLLKAGSEGELAFLINSVKEPYHYFWITGMLSAFLDNAPTYLTFFNTALGSFYTGMAESQSVPLLMSENAVYPKAISTGAVFFGAFSYIGDAPNFMVRSIAIEARTPMPSFFGYIFKYALIFLIPTFLVVTIIFF
ncbi:MAG: sodium:proton antiporter [Desulfarculaceae bacterium]|nr:sodium:proton antiporter [Desulfarculaceae bacterium]